MSEIIKDLQSMRIRKRPIWKPVMQKHNFTHICEIGVREGINFKRMIEHNPQVAVAVDSWINDGIKSRNDGLNTQEELDGFYETFKKEMEDKLFVTIYRGYSFEASFIFPNRFFHLVYIDGDHSYLGCLRDIRDWWPKVKIGGVLTGHDYVHNKSKRTGEKFKVIEAVQTFLNDNKLHDDFFTFSRSCWGILRR